MKAHPIPVGQRIIDAIHRRRYLVTAILIVINAGAICLARSTSGGHHARGPVDVAASVRPDDGRQLLLEIMDGQMNPVPEPGSAGLLLGGLVALLLKRPLPRRR